MLVHSRFPPLRQSIRHLGSALLFLSLSTAALQAQTDLDTVETQIRTVFGAPDNPSDPNQVAAANAILTSANNLLGKIEPNNGQGTNGYFTDQNDLNTNPNDIHYTLERIQVLAQAYQTGTPSFPAHNLQYAQAAYGGLIKINQYYNQAVNPGGNGFFLCCWNPKNMAYAAILIQPSGVFDNPWNGQTLYLSNIYNTIDHYAPPGTTCSTTPFCTGSNLVDQETGIMLAGILAKDTTQVTNAVTLIKSVLNDVAPPAPGTVPSSSQDGFYSDGSYIQHSSVPYTGKYGADLLNDIAAETTYLGNTEWAFTSAQFTTMCDWIPNTYEPVLFEGGLQPVSIGRFTADASTHQDAAYLVNSIAQLAVQCPAAQQQSIANWITNLVASDTTGQNYYLTDSSVARTAALESLRALGASSAAPITPGIYSYPQMQRYIDQEGTYAFAIDLFSNAINAFENGGGSTVNQGTNGAGWYEGAGAVYLNNADQTQFDLDFWSTVDFTRLSGTTTDGFGIIDQKGYQEYLNPDAWVGSSVVNKQFASAGMNFSMTGDTKSNLNGWKSYFLMGDKMIALGVVGGGGAGTETIIENRKLNSSGDEFSVNGNSFPTPTASNPGATVQIPNVTYAAISDGSSTPATNIGYYFPTYAAAPTPPTLNVLYQQRTGTIGAISGMTGGTSYTRNYASMSFYEGCSVSGCSSPESLYAYAVLPGKSSADMATYKPDFSVLSNSSVLQAVAETFATESSTEQVVGANFWAAAQLNDPSGVAFLTSNAATSVTTVETGSGTTGEIDLGISDPTQATSGTFQLTLNRTTTVPPVQPNVQVAGSAGQTLITITRTSDAHGRSYLIKLSENSPSVVAGTDTADSYVWDGGPTTNYGSSGTMYIKNAGTGYTRIGYLKLDVSGFSGAIGKATLTLTPVAFGIAGLTESLHSVSATSWQEGTITWQTAPSVDSSVIASAKATTLNQPIQFDVTSLAIKAQANGGVFSVAIEGPAGISGDPSVTFATKENATAAYRPTLALSR